MKSLSLSFVFLAACQPPLDSKPRIETPADQDTNEDTEIPIDWRSHVLDDVSPVANVRIASATVTTGKGTVTDTGDGWMTYDPRDKYEELQHGTTVTDEITLVLVDGQGNQSDPIIYRVNVRGEDDAPVARMLKMSTDQNTVGSVDLPADVDIDDAATSLTAEFSSGPAGTAVLAAGKLTFDPGTSYRTLAQGKSVTVDMHYTLVDPAMMASDQEVLRISLAGLNDEPTAEDFDVTVPHNRVTRIPMLSHAHDVDQGEALTLVDATGLSATAGTVTVDGSDVTFVPAGGLSAGQMYDFLYTVSDPHGVMASGMVTLNIATGGSSTVNADRAVFVLGQTAPVLSWSATGFAACSVNAGPDVLSSAPSGSISDFAPRAGEPITLDCTDASGSASKTFPIAFQPAFFVDGTRASTGDGASWETAFTTLTEGVLAASGFGGNVWVKEGTYTAVGGASAVVVVPPRIALYGGFPSALTGATGDVSALARQSHTVIDATGTEHGVYAPFAEDVTIDGFAIRDAVSSNVGAGVYAGGGTGSLYIHSCEITDNVVASSGIAAGGGLSASFLGLVDIRDTAFERNVVHGGGAPIVNIGQVALGAGAYIGLVQTVVIDNTVFSQNVAIGGTGADHGGQDGDNGGDAQGGGLWVGSASSLTCTRCTFADNVIISGHAGGGTGGDHDGYPGNTLGGGAYVSLSGATGSVDWDQSTFLSNAMTIGPSGGFTLPTAPLPTGQGGAYWANVVASTGPTTVSGNTAPEIVE